MNQKVFDISPAGNVSVIHTDLLSFPNRNDVKYVVTDMKRAFRDIAKTFLPNAKIVINKFHVVRIAVDVMDNVRRRIRKALPPE